MALTPEGLVIKRYATLLAEKRQRAIDRYQDLVTPGDSVDVSDSSALGRLIALSIPSEADLWEAVQQVYNAFNPNAAIGYSLDDLVELGGLVRFRNTRTTSQAVLKGDVGTTIPRNSVVSSPTTSQRFNLVGNVILGPDNAVGIELTVVQVVPNTAYTISYSSGTGTESITYTSTAAPTTQQILSGLAAIINSEHPLLMARVDGDVLVVDSSDIFQTKNFSATDNLGIVKATNLGELSAEDYGPISQPTNTITTITTPVLGWDSVYNPTPASPGRFEETDEQLRNRFRESKYERASNILESLYTALMSLDDVTELMIYENDSDVYDENGVPPHSFMPVILGGIGSEIANTIWRNKPLGIRSHGNTSVTIFDSQSFPHVISFERPNPVSIFITLNITADNRFPAEGASRIRDELVSYFSNHGIGNDVIYSRLFTPINKIPGHQVDSMFIGTSANPTQTGNITIPFNGLATVNPDNIVINVTGQ